MARRFLTTLNLAILDSDPISSSAGDMYYNSVSNLIRYYNGTQWLNINQSSGEEVEYVVYSPEPPSNPFSGQVWVESDLDILSGGAAITIDGGNPSSSYTDLYDGGSPSSTYTIVYDGGSE